MQNALKDLALHRLTSPLHVVGRPQRGGSSPSGRQLGFDGARGASPRGPWRGERAGQLRAIWASESVLEGGKSPGWSGSDRTSPRERSARGPRERSGEADQARASGIARRGGSGWVRAPQGLREHESRFTLRRSGEVAERSNVPVSKTGEGQPSGGSNPPFSVDGGHNRDRRQTVRRTGRGAPRGT